MRCKEIIRSYTGKEFPADPYEQLRQATEAVFRSWNGKRAVDYRNASNIPHDLGTAVNIQTMVFGNMGEDSATGVFMSRNATTGEPHLEGDFLDAHALGFGLYERRSRLQQIERRLAAAQQRSKQIELLFVERSAALLAPDLLPSERAAIAVEIRHLGEERHELAASIHDLEIECDHAAAEYERYREELARLD